MKISANSNYFSNICIYLLSVLCTFALGLALERSKFKVSMRFIFKLSFSLIFSFFLQYLINYSYLCDYFIHLDGHINYWLLFIVPVFVIFARITGILFKKIFREISKYINHDNEIVKIIMYVLIVIIPLLVKIYNPYISGGGLLTTTWIFSNAASGVVALY